MVDLVIFGVTGAVGLEVMYLLEQKIVKFNKLKLLASKKSAGIEVCILDKIYIHCIIVFKRTY